MACRLSIPESEVKSLTRTGIRRWLTACLSRLGIEHERECYEKRRDCAVLSLEGDYDHCLICYRDGQYWLQGFNPYTGDDCFITGRGDLEAEIQSCRDECFRTE